MFGAILRGVSVFAGIAVTKTVSKILPVSVEGLKADPVSTIGSVLVNAVLTDATVKFVEDKVVDILDSIAVAQAVTAAQAQSETEPKPDPEFNKSKAKAKAAK